MIDNPKRQANAFAALVCAALFAAVLFLAAVAQAEPLTTDEAELRLEQQMRESMRGSAPPRWETGAVLFLGLADAYTTNQTYKLAERSPFVEFDDQSPLWDSIAGEPWSYLLPVAVAFGARKADRWLNRAFGKEVSWLTRFFAGGYGWLAVSGSRDLGESRRFARDGADLLSRICAVPGLIDQVQGLPAGTGCN